VNRACGADARRDRRQLEDARAVLDYQFVPEHSYVVSLIAFIVVFASLPTKDWDPSARKPGLCPERGLEYYSLSRDFLYQLSEYGLCHRVGRL
jgi:hypothetical protein